jgi:hypothetical protein
VLQIANNASSANEVNFTDVLPSMPPFGAVDGRLTKPDRGSKESRRGAPRLDLSARAVASGIMAVPARQTAHDMS